MFHRDETVTGTAIRQRGNGESVTEPEKSSAAIGGSVTEANMMAGGGAGSVTETKMTVGGGAGSVTETGILAAGRQRTVTETSKRGRARKDLLREEVDCILAGEHGALDQDAFVDLVVARVLRVGGADRRVARPHKREHARHAAKELREVLPR